MSNISSENPTFSFEFFPPKTDKGQDNLQATWQTLAALKPRFFSVTFGAGGTTQDRTRETVIQIQKTSGVEAAPHLSCVGSTRENISKILDAYQQAEIKHIVALRGDLPSGTLEVGEFRFANELVAFIREHSGDHFHIEVAAYPESHPESRTPGSDLNNFVSKVKAGANSAITQYFYNADAYFNFVDECQKKGLDIPVVPGIMPITNYMQLARFSDVCGTEIPRWIRSRLEAYGEDLDSIRAFGFDVVADMCRRLLEQGAPGLHFYSMNKVEPSLSLWKELGLPSD